MLGQTPGRSSLLQRPFAALRLRWSSSSVAWLSPGERRSDAALQPWRGGSGGCRCWICSGEDPGDVHGAGSLRVSGHRPRQQLHALLHGPVAGFRCRRPDNRCAPPGTPRALPPGEVGWLRTGGPRGGGEEPLCRSPARLGARGAMLRSAAPRGPQELCQRRGVVPAACHPLPWQGAQDGSGMKCSRGNA